MRYWRLVNARSIVVAAALVWLLPVDSAAQPAIANVTAVEMFDPMNILGLGAVGVPISPGTVTCPGAQPTGNPLQPCPVGSRTKLRGVSGKSRMMSDSPLLSGWFYWELNANFDAEAAGRVWGSFRLEPDAGGAWEGTFVDDRTKVPDINLWIGRARWVGRGSGGDVDGMQLRFTQIASTFTPIPVAWVAPVDAEVLAPPRGRHR